MHLWRQHIYLLPGTSRTVWNKAEILRVINPKLISRRALVLEEFPEGGWYQVWGSPALAEINFFSIIVSCRLWRGGGSSCPLLLIPDESILSICAYSILCRFDAHILLQTPPCLSPSSSNGNTSPHNNSITCWTCNMNWQSWRQLGLSLGRGGMKVQVIQPGSEIN